MKKNKFGLGCGLMVAAFVAGGVRFAAADGFPPYWDDRNGAVHYPPAAWPAEPQGGVTACAQDCGEWKPYTRFQSGVNDPRTQDPSNGGTRPQNYVNIASSCIDKAYPSVYYSLRQGATEADDVIMFRWRVEQQAHTYATGPSPGNFGAVDPWGSALWTVLFDVDGDGIRDVAAHLDGSSGAPATAIDMIAGIWGNIPTQSIDYLDDPSIHLIAHNPTAYIGGVGDNRVLNFDGTANAPSESWPNGAAETVWDYGTTRAQLVSTNSCNEYFIDYQIPVAMLDASGLGGPKLTRSSPLSMLFCTANSLNNPFQKDCALNREWISDPNLPGPFGDYISFNQEDPYSQPIVTNIEATPPLDCNASPPDNYYRLSARVQDTLAVVNGEVVKSVQAVSFWYWFDADGDGNDDEPGGMWKKVLNQSAAADATPDGLNAWLASWDTSALPKGQYLVGVQALDDNTLVDDDIVPSGIDNRTISYVAGNAQNEITQGGSFVSGITFPGHDPGMTPTASEDWWGNPAVTGVQTALIDVAVNVCGVAPTVEKSVSPDFVTVGQEVSFSLTVRNPSQNPSAVNLTQLQDQLPAGFSYKADSTTGVFGTVNPSVSGQTLTWSGSASIPAGGAVSLGFIAVAPASETGTYSNNGSAFVDGGEIAAEPVQVGVGSPRLSISKVPDSYSTTPGSTVTYTITYSNDSPVNVTGAVITDSVPDGLTYVPASCSGGCSFSDPVLTWAVGSLAAGEGPYSVTFEATVDNPYSEAAINENTASIDSNETSPADAQAKVYIDTPRPSLSLNKSAGSALVDPGATVTYTLEYANTGNADSTGTVLTDTLPDGFTFVSATNPSAGACTSTPSLCSESGGVVTWNLGTLTPGGSGTVTVTAQAGDPFVGAANPATNNAAISSNEVTTPVVDGADTGVKQSGQVCTTYYLSNQQDDVGNAGTHYLASATSPGGSAATLQKYIPTGSDAAPVVVESFYQDPASGQLVSFDGSSTFSGQIYYTKSSALGGSGSASLTLFVKIYDYDPVLGGETLLGSTSYLDNGSPTPPVPLSSVTPSGSLAKGHRLRIEVSVQMALSNKDTTVELQVETVESNVEICSPPPANLVLEKRVDIASVAASGSGRTLTYTLDYANTSTVSAANSATIVDTLPAGASFASATLNGGSITPSGTNPYTFALGNVAAGGEGSLVIVANLADDLGGISELTNSAQIQSDETASAPTGGATATTIVIGTDNPSGTPNVLISKQADDTLLVPGDTVTYTLTAVNAGDKAATSVVVSDDFPDQAYFIYATCDANGNGSCAESGGVLTWNLGSLGAGQSADLTFTMTVQSAPAPPTGVTSLDNFASATYGGGGTGSDTSNTVTVSISTNPNLSIVKTVDPAGGTRSPGDVLTYAIEVSNQGAGTATAVVVSDPIPAYTSFKAGTINPGPGSGSFDAVNNRVLFDVGDLAGGGVANLSFQVTINDPLPSGSTVLTNTATVTASNAATRNSSVTSNASASPLLSISKSGPKSVAYPAARLTAAADAATTLFVDDTAHLTVGQLVRIGGQTVVVTALNGTSMDVNSAVTAAVDAQVVGAVVYNLAYQNTGNADASGVVITDTLPSGPPGLTYQSSNPDTPDNPGVGNSGVVSWTIGDLAAGAGGSVQVTVFPTAAGVVNNPATIDSNETSLVSSDVDTSFGGLTVTKWTSTPISSAGGSADYTIRVSNSTASAINGVQVKDLLPSGFTYQANSSSGTSEPVFESGDAGRPIWTVDVPANGSVDIGFSVDIGGSVGPATYQNGVELTKPGVGIAPFDELLTTAEDVTVLAPGTGLVDGYVYRDNNANGSFDPTLDTPLANVAVHITDAGSTLYIVYTDSEGYFSRVVQAGSALVDVDDTTLPSGLVLTGGTDGVDPSNVAVPDGGQGSRNTGYVPPGSSSSDMSVSIAGLPAAAPPGQTVNGTVTCSNVGSTAAVNASCALAGGTLSNCVQNPGATPLSLPVSVAALSTGHSIVCDLAATMPGSGSLTLTASTGADNDSNALNNTDVENVTVSFTNVFDPPSGRKTVDAAGNPVYEWRMVWINNGNQVANEVRVEDPIPTGTEYVNGSLNCVPMGASSTTTCTYEAGNNRVVWEGTIAADYQLNDEASAANEVVISFQTRLLNGVNYAENLAHAYWDENGIGGVADDIAGSQTPVPTNDNAPVGPARPVPVLPPVALALLLLLLALGGWRSVRARR